MAGSAAEARLMMEPRGTFRVFDLVSVEGPTVRLGDGICLAGLRQAHLFKGAAKIALCGFTLGGTLEQRCNSLALAGDHPESSLLSLIGDCALAEGQAKLLEEVAVRLGGTFARGTTLQPGAAYWGIEANKIFFEALPLASLGMTMMESFALHPAKSKTFACAFRNEIRDSQ